MEPFEQKVRRGGATALESVDKFFQGEDEVHITLRDMTTRLAALGISYAITGGMAVFAHGYERTTIDVDVLVTPEGLAETHRALDGNGYVRASPGSKHLRSVQTGVRVVLRVAGEYPGDAKPKPVSFPDPAAVAVEMNGIRYVSLAALIEVKLASNITSQFRIKDLADVQELIRYRRLGRDVASQLHPFVRDTYVQLWQELQAASELE